MQSCWACQINPAQTPLHINHQSIRIGGCARIYAFGLDRLAMLVRVTAELCSSRQIFVPKATMSIVRKCNVFGVKKACGLPVNHAVNVVGHPRERSRERTHRRRCGRSISNSIPCVAGHQSKWRLWWMNTPVNHL
jgi:hypothetical protein